MGLHALRKACEMNLGLFLSKQALDVAVHSPRRCTNLQNNILHLWTILGRTNNSHEDSVYCMNEAIVSIAQVVARFSPSLKSCRPPWLKIGNSSVLGLYPTYVCKPPFRRHLKGGRKMLMKTLTKEEIMYGFKEKATEIGNPVPSRCVWFKPPSCPTRMINGKRLWEL